MSDDLIRRSDAIEAIEEVTWYHQTKNKDMVSGANSAEHQAWYKAEDIYKALEAVPTADRPQGERKNYKDEPQTEEFEEPNFEKICFNENEDYDDVDQFVCSKCGIHLQGWYRVDEDDFDEGIVHEYTLRFCPNCGAKVADRKTENSSEKPNNCEDCIWSVCNYNKAFEDESQPDCQWK